MSGSKETKTQKVLPDEEPTLNLRYDHKLIKVPAVARVQIHAASAPQVKDTLVLRSTEGKEKADCTYWKERPVKEASMSDGFLNLSFAPGRNDGTAERAREDRRYTLIWRPGGKKEAAVVLVEDRPYETIWKTGPDDSPDRIAELMAIRVQEAGDVILPDRKPSVLSGPDVPSAIRETDEDVADAGAPLGGEISTPMPDPETAKPMKSRSGSGGGQGGEDNGPSLPPGPRWITMMRWKKGGLEPLVVCKVTSSKKYKCGAFGDDGSLSMQGSSQSDVLVPVNQHAAPDEVDSNADADVFARMSLVEPTRKRVEQEARQTETEERSNWNEESPGSSFVPLSLTEVLSADGPTPATTQLESPAQSEAPGPGGTVRLPNPLAAAQRRLGTAKTAHKRFTAWRNKVKDTVGLTGLVGGTCFNKTFGRTYLQKALAASDSDADSSDSTQSKGWGRFLQKGLFEGTQKSKGPFGSALESGWFSDGTDTRLGTVLHGHQCQWAYLTLKRDRALRATRGVYTSAAFKALIYDITVRKKKKDKGNAARSILRVVAQTTSLGETASVAKALCEDGALSGSVQSALSTLMSGKKGVLAPEGPAEAPMLKALVKLAQRSKGTLKAFAVNTAPAILAVGGRRGDLSTSVDGPASLALLGAFLTAERAGGSVSVSTETDSEGRKTLRVTGGSTATFVQKRVPGLSHRRAEDQTRWSVQNVEGLSSVTVGAGGDPSDALELAVVGVRRREQPTSGALNVKDGFGYVKTATELAEAATDRKSLSGLVTVFTGVEVAWGVVDALSAEREQGWKKVDDPQYFAAGAALLKVAVGAAAGAAVGSGGGAAVVGMLVGRALSGPIDAAAAWLERWENLDEDIADDPLIERAVVEKGTEPENFDLAEQPKTEREKYTEDEVQYSGWLAEQSHWGTRFSGDGSARDALATLVEPGKDKSGGAPPPKPFRDQTEAFVEKAFTFPTAVGVPPKPALDLPDRTSGPPQRLFLSIIPGYVPKKRGTFLVDASVESQERSMMGESVEIAVAVHYVEVEGEVRYLVLPPKTRVGLEGSLKETARNRNWAVARREDTPMPGGGEERRMHLPIHVGYWPVRTGDPKKQSRLRNKWKDARDRGLVEAPATDQDWQRWQASARQQKAAKELSKVHWTSQVPPPKDFEPILQSGRFEVTGFVSFNPLQPFNPSPKIPEGDPLKSDRMLARARIEYSYPG